MKERKKSHLLHWPGQLGALTRTVSCPSCVHTLSTSGHPIPSACPSLLPSLLLRETPGLPSPAPPPPWSLVSPFWSRVLSSSPGFPWGLVFVLVTWHIVTDSPCLAFAFIFYIFQPAVMFVFLKGKNSLGYMESTSMNPPTGKTPFYILSSIVSNTGLSVYFMRVYLTLPSRL